MIVSVTGATGFLGSHLVDRLIADGNTVRAMVRRTSNLRWLQGKPVECMECSFRNPDTLIPFVRNADYIYHVAGVVKARTREEYFFGNETATRELLAAAEAHAPGCRRLLLVSSLTASGPSPALDRPVREDTPCRPITTYGESKVAAENVLRNSSGKIPWTIVRPPAIFGPRDTEILVYFQTIARGLNSIIGLNDKRLSLLHSDDLVRGLVLAAEAAVSAGQTYFITSDNFYSWDEVGRTCAAVLQGRSVTLRVPHSIVYLAAALAQAFASIRRQAATLNIEKAKDITQTYWTCDWTKAEKELGFRQEISLEEGIRDTFNWYRAQGWLKP